MSAVVQLKPQQESLLSLTPLQPTIGAEISDIDLKGPLEPEIRDALRAAILQYKVLFFRDQHLSREEQAAFASQFGPLYTHPFSTKKPQPDVAQIQPISAADFSKYDSERKKYGDEIQESYHTDSSWRLVPAWGAVLRAVTLPDAGGDTIWVDAGLAYRNLDEKVKERLEGLFVTHDFRPALNAIGYDYPIVAHPIVRTHRETGEKILWVNYSQHPQIIGLDRAESREILELIVDQYRKPEYQVRFKWSPGAVAFWDNRAAVHYAVRNYGDFPRVVERILIADEKLWADL